MTSTLNKQEELFLSRVAMKMIETGEGIEQAMRSVLKDDRRIVSKALALHEQGRNKFSALSDAVYDKIRARQVPA